MFLVCDFMLLQLLDHDLSIAGYGHASGDDCTTIAEVKFGSWPFEY